MQDNNDKDNMNGLPCELEILIDIKLNHRIIHGRCWVPVLEEPDANVFNLCNTVNCMAV